MTRSEAVEGAGERWRPFRGLRTLSIMPTYTCTAACADCASLSTPKERTRLASEDIFAAIDEARKLGFYNVVFTGGEATLRWGELLKWIAHAAKLGFPTRIVTNAHWATRPETARDRIEQLAAAGLSEINYSTGDEHARFVPIERVAHAVVAAFKRKMPVHVMIEMRDGNGITRDTLLDHPILAELTEDERKTLSVVASPWMPLVHDRTNRYPQGAAAQEDNIGLRMGCDSVLQTYTLQADGRIGACCGLGMRLIDELQVGLTSEPERLTTAIAAAETDFLKLWLHYSGPEKIIAWAAQHDKTIQWQGMYSHHCQFCQRLYHDPQVRAVVREHWQEVISEVLQAAWLDQVAVPDAMGEQIRTALTEAASLCT